MRRTHVADMAQLELDAHRGQLAASLAGHLQLGKLVCLYGDNRVTLAAPQRDRA